METWSSLLMFLPINSGKVAAEEVKVCLSRRSLDHPRKNWAVGSRG